MRKKERTTLSKRFPEQLRRPARVPNFDSGVISEPLLTFGGGHTHVDPKTGLALYGPYGPKGQTRAPLRSIIAGIIGPASMVADAEAWLQGCQGILSNDGTQPFLYPHFPGFNSDSPFECEFVFGDTWRECIKDSEIKEALADDEFQTRVKGIVRLYVRSLEVLANRDPKPNVVLCCIPDEVISACTVPRRRPARRRRMRGSKRRNINQMFLFDSQTGLGIEDDEGGHQNLRRRLKAEAMQLGLPTQLVWPRTLKLSASADSGQRVQDIATRAWNFTTAMYHKAGGSPWRLAELQPGTCFVGLSFYRELLGENPAMRTSMAQAFTSAGDGYVLRGNTFEWNQQGPSPHLTKDLASGLLRDVIQLYQRQNRGSLPTRIVVHKSSRFWEEEIAGLEEACEIVPLKDFVSLGQRGIQFYRTGDYPPLRGTYVKFSDTDLLLYTSGYVPFLRTYPGPRVPQPLEVMEHYGDSPWDLVLKEVLALTKMNWNTADFSSSEPITLAFSRRVGDILAEMPSDWKPHPEYRYYM
jgi:hypothetical protein